MLTFNYLFQMITKLFILIYFNFSYKCFYTECFVELISCYYYKNGCWSILFTCFNFFYTRYCYRSSP